MCVVSIGKGERKRERTRSTDGCSPHKGFVSRDIFVECKRDAIIPSTVVIPPLAGCEIRSTSSDESCEVE